MSLASYHCSTPRSIGTNLVHSSTHILRAPPRLVQPFFANGLVRLRPSARMTPRPRLARPPHECPRFLSPPRMDAPPLGGLPPVRMAAPAVPPQLRPPS